MKRGLRGALVTTLLVLVAGLTAGPVPATAAGAAPVAPRAGLDCMRGDGSFKVVSQRLVTRPSGSVSVFADIRNKTRQWRRDIRGQLCFYDAAGRVIGNELAISDPLVVGPRRRSPFVVTDAAPSGWRSYTLRFTSKRSHRHTVDKRVKVTTGHIGVDSTGSLNVPVRVRNRNKFAIRHTAVYVTLFDAAGRILSYTEGYNYTKPAKIRPGRTGRFTAFAFGYFQGVHRARIQIETWRR